MGFLGICMLGVSTLHSALQINSPTTDWSYYMTAYYDYSWF